MLSKPDLIIFSQNLLGGGASFHRNMLTKFPKDFFNIKCIYLDPIDWDGAKALDISNNENDCIFPYGKESNWEMAKRLSKLIPNSPGAIVANLEQELIYLDIYRKEKKTVYFICHDDGFLPLAIKYQSLIDIFIAHNASVYEELLKLMNGRKNGIYFIEHGVNVIEYSKKHNTTQKLRIVFLARHHQFKGIFDLPEIDALLVEKGVQVEWTILGDGPDKGALIEKTSTLPNFTFTVPKTTAAVIEILKQQDIFILPSRKDGLPVALLEAMSVGCVPVISNFSEGIKKVVTPEIGFVIPIGNNDLFADKIAFFDKNRVELQKYSAKCIERIRKDFDIEKQALKYFDLYKQFKNFRKKRTIHFKDILRIGKYHPYTNKVISVFERVFK